MEAVATRSPKQHQVSVVRSKNQFSTTLSAATDPFPLATTGDPATAAAAAAHKVSYPGSESLCKALEPTGWHMVLMLQSVAACPQDAGCAAAGR